MRPKRVSDKERAREDEHHCGELLRIAPLPAVLVARGDEMPGLDRVARRQNAAERPHREQQHQDQEQRLSIKKTPHPVDHRRPRSSTSILRRRSGISMPRFEARSEISTRQRSMALMRSSSAFTSSKFLVEITLNSRTCSVRMASWSAFLETVSALLMAASCSPR